MDVKKVVLFVVLLLAVGFLGWKAFQKYKEFNPSPPPPGQTEVEQPPAETVKTEAAPTTGAQ